MSSRKSHRIKALLDTNVLISSFLTEGLSKELLLRARRGEFTALTCPFILGEFKEKLEKKFQIKPSDIEEALELMKDACILVSREEIEPPKEIYLRDESDINVLLCALAGKADFLVTGDKDLLEIKAYGEIRIVSPREFLNLLEAIS